MVWGKLPSVAMVWSGTVMVGIFVVVVGLSGGVARQDVERRLAKILDKTVGTLPPLLLVQYVCDEP